MSRAPFGFLLRCTTAASRQTPGGAGDAELLERYTATRDEHAFAELVLRHGALVLGVCERLLGRSQDAEDAFQATFLVLARRAAAVRKPAALASWLYGVAARVAHKVRTAAAVRRLRESHATPPAPAASADDMTWRELRQVLDEELQQLPEKYRLPLLLCYLEGHTHDEAARQLGWTPGCFVDRLKRGRQRLRSRLQRRGVGLPAALGAALLSQRVAGAAAGPVLRFALARAGNTADGVTPEATALAEGVVRGMRLVKWKVTAVVLLALGALAAGASAMLSKAPVPQPAAALADAAPAKPAPRRPVPVAEPPRNDLFGDPLPPYALARMGTVRFRHGYLISSLAMSPDGKTVVTAGSDQAVRIWDLDTGKELRRYSQQKTFRPFALALSPDGNLLAAADSGISIWDLGGKAKERQLTVGDQVPRALAFSPDSQLLASSDGKLIRLWDVAAGKELRRWEGHESGTLHLAFAPDGRRLASSGPDHAVRLWDATTGKRLHQFPGVPTDDAVSSLAFSADGKGLVSGSTENTVRWWNVETGEEVRSFKGHEKDVSFVTFTRDGKTLASAGRDRTIRLWDATTGQEKHCIRGLPWPATALAFSADGATLLSGGVWDSTIHRWEVATGKEIRAAGAHQGLVDAVALLPDGKTVISASRDNTLRLWDRQTGKEIQREALPELSFRAILFSPDRRTLAFTQRDGTKLRLWDVPSGKEVRALDQTAGEANCLAFAPDGKRLVTGGQDGKVRLWDLAEGKKLRVIDAHTQEVTCLEFAPDGMTLVSAGDRGLALWDVATGKELHRVSGIGTPINVLRFSPDGKLLAGGGFSNELILADVAGRRLLRTLQVGGDYVSSIAFSPDGRLLAASGEKQGCQVFELTTGDRIAHFPGDAGALAFSADSRTLLAGNHDSTIVLWDVTGQSVHAREWQTLRAEHFDRVWADLASPKALAGHRALWALAGGDARTVRRLQERLRPVVITDAARITHLLKDLQSGDFSRREEAGQELEKLGEQIEPQLREALTKQPPLELRRRIEQLLARLDQPNGPGDWLRRTRALAALEQMDAPEAEQLLKILAGGAKEARLTREARMSLERKARRPQH